MLYIKYLISIFVYCISTRALFAGGLNCIWQKRLGRGGGAQPLKSSQNKTEWATDSRLSPPIGCAIRPMLLLTENVNAEPAGKRRRQYRFFLLVRRTTKVFRKRVMDDRSQRGGGRRGIGRRENGKTRVPSRYLLRTNRAGRRLEKPTTVEERRTAFLFQSRRTKTTMITATSASWTAASDRTSKRPTDSLRRFGGGAVDCWQTSTAADGPLSPRRVRTEPAYLPAEIICHLPDHTDITIYR